MGKIQLLSIGDATYDVFMSPDESEAICEIKSKECMICFDYGEKIPVKHLDFSIGGNAANNAIGASRLGVKVAVVLTLGSDDIGNQILKLIESEGVDSQFIIQQPSSTSNYSTVINYSGERTIFTYNAPKSYEFPVRLPEVEWVYLTSMGDSFLPFYKHLLDWIKINPQIKLAFNPGSRQLRSLDNIMEIISRSYILYVNREEAERITNFGKSSGKEHELLDALVKVGVKNPIVTDGSNGSYVYTSGKYLKCGICPIDAYERTGAGDAFGSGCISALIKGKTFEEALVWGTVNSASVIGYIGSQRGLLRESEMQVWLDRAKSSNVKVEEF